MAKQMGISLSEVLISLFLASVLMTCLIQFYLKSKQQYVEIEKVLITSLDLQWVSDLLSDSIRRAGFTPCLGLDQLQVIDHRNPKNKLQALFIENQPTQYIQVNRMSEHFTPLLRTDSTTQLIVHSPLQLSKEKPILIVDCEHAEIHKLIAINQQAKETRLTLSKPLFYSYGVSTYVGAFIEERWLIQKNTEDKMTLHYQSGQTEEVSPLIHSLSVKKYSLQNQKMILLTLGFEQKEAHQLRVAIRGS